MALALLAACASRPKVACTLELPPALRALPDEIQLRLALIRRFQCNTTCAPNVPPEQHGGLYTMEPPDTSFSALLSYCELHDLAATQIGNDLLRIYGGCDLCIDQCAAGNPRALDDCRSNCSMASLADYDAHQAQLSTLFSAADYGFLDWRRLLEPLPTPSVPRDQSLTCPLDPGLAPDENKSGMIRDQENLAFVCMMSLAPFALRRH
jgi:hypothetical protein